MPFSFRPSRSSDVREHAASPMSRHKAEVRIPTMRDPPGFTLTLHGLDFKHVQRLVCHKRRTVKSKGDEKYLLV